MTNITDLVQQAKLESNLTFDHTFWLFQRSSETNTVFKVGLKDMFIASPPFPLVLPTLPAFPIFSPLEDPR